MKKKKDILFLCQFFYPEYISSATLPYDTALALQKAGFSVDALCGSPKEYAEGTPVPKKETVEGIGIHRLKYLQLSRAGFLGRLVNYLSFTLRVLCHLGKLANYRAVIVYSNPPILPWLTVWAKKLFGTKLIFVAYDLYPEMAVRTNTLRDGSIICRLMDHINRRVYPNADAVVALSSEMREFILKNRSISPEKIHVIPNWYADQEPAACVKSENPFSKITGGRFTVAYFGNMGTLQDMETITQAVRLLKGEDVFFLFAGHGNKFQKVKDFLEAEQVENAAIYPFLHGKDFQDALAISDCALVCLDTGLTGTCVPSKTYSYMMRGIPLAAIMDESDIVGDVETGAGLWVRNGQFRELAEHILWMKDHPEECARMGKRCRQIFLEKYTTEICTDQYVRLLSEFLKDQRR